ncbi:MAG: hypothetical protein HRT77_14790 [Halioglobus sp.]|nr:hypothetical protein [Halioglobus sp.]
MKQVVTADRLEPQFQINARTQLAFTQLLLPALVKAAPAGGDDGRTGIPARRVASAARGRRLRHFYVAWRRRKPLESPLFAQQQSSPDNQCWAPLRRSLCNIGAIFWYR